MKLGLSAILLSACVTAVAWADEPVNRLGPIRFETDAWSFCPVYQPADGLVVAIVAIAKPDAVVGDNLNTVLFIRDGNFFDAYSWVNATRAQAVYSSKMILNVSDEDDDQWALEEELPWLLEDAPRPPAPYHAGMLTDDPLFEAVMGSSNPNALVEMLAAIGYPVAEPQRNGGGEYSNPPCPDDAYMRPMVNIMEWMVDQSEEVQRDLSITIPAVSSFMSSTTCGGEPGTCDPWTSAWTVLPAYEVPPACGWFLESTSVILNEPGVGTHYSCEYVAKKSFVQHRYRTERMADCSEISRQECRKLVKVLSQITCQNFKAWLGPAPSCPALPLGATNCGPIPMLPCTNTRAPNPLNPPFGPLPCN